MRVPTRVYLAARFARAADMEAVADELEKRGLVVSSRWHGDPSHSAENAGPNEPPDAFNRRCALDDLEDVRACDVLIAFLEGEDGGGRGGRHVEFGLAVGLGKPIITIGRREHVFHWLPDVDRVADWLTFVERFDWFRSRGEAAGIGPSAAAGLALMLSGSAP